MRQKLYRCEVSVVYYALAGSPEEAHEWAAEAVTDAGASEYTEVEITDGAMAASDGWTPDSLVYHDGPDCRLVDAIKRSTELPE